MSTKMRQMSFIEMMKVAAKREKARMGDASRSEPMSIDSGEDNDMDFNMTSAPIPQSTLPHTTDHPSPMIATPSIPATTVAEGTDC